MVSNPGLRLWKRQGYYDLWANIIHNPSPNSAKNKQRISDPSIYSEKVKIKAIKLRADVESSNQRFDFFLYAIKSVTFVTNKTANAHYIVFNV